MSRTADPSTAIPEQSTDAQPPATAAEVRQVYQAIRTLVPEHGRVSAADLAAVTDLERERVSPAMRRLAGDGPFDVGRIETGDLAAWTVRR